MANIIINEFLTFVQNKIDVLDEISIVQICATNFTDSEVEDGKAALYSACGSTSSRIIQRKGEDKRKKNIKDVIKLMKEVDPDLQPTFVAKDLNRLPPVSFDHVDVTRLLKDVSKMMCELSEFKTKVSLEIEDLRKSMMSDGARYIHTGCSPRKLSSSNTMTTPSKSLPPVSVPHAKAPTQAHRDVTGLDDVVAPSLYTPTYRDIVCDKERQAKSARMRNINSGGFRSTQKCSMGHVASQVSNTDTILCSNDTGFKIVERKKRKPKNLNMRGTSVSQCKIQVADPECSIYVSRALKSVTESNIEEYIRDMGEECISVEKLAQNRETSFNSFKVRIPASKANTFLDAKFWPAGLVYRRFKERFLSTAASKKL
ncbi:uncharacterized protein LOC121732066 [Aricia agestis]|uniref:uncharacterized protein LOC121732066 n=1 Tax=Aricia agestis TaxID=91739 RepID=UPI001C20B81E|nr:uncharacterized protein LOC121732066 [Aricia agestis]